MRCTSVSRSVVALSIILIAIAVAPLHGRERAMALQVPPATPMSPDLAAAQAFLSVAYPELVGRRATFSFNQVGRRVTVSITEPSNPMAGSSGQIEALVDGTIDLTDDRRVQSFSARGALLNTGMNRAFREKLFAEPHVSDGQAETWLVAAGGTIGPAGRAQIEARLNTQSWQSFLGANPEASTPEFTWRDEAATGMNRPFRATPAWTVIVAAGTGSARANYRLEFEPFGGRLIAVTRQ